MFRRWNPTGQNRTLKVIAKPLMAVYSASWFHILSSPGNPPRLPNSKPGKFHELPEKDEPLCSPEPYQQRWPTATPICGPGLGSSRNV